eukprot:CAMPEP_0117551506 /NCGR_PEP_ID=MMETSP0784-20121206/49226_1 /TAXON_ID=39447 /ORGANISM="" /LENGTH=221 /DNA_ID=CAMNT_0005348547 /DNA_START=80 /DNA_END=742 /DNA_ORIENTATION=-
MAAVDTNDVSGLYRKTFQLKGELEKELEAFVTQKNTGAQGGTSPVAAQQRLAMQSAEFAKNVVELRSAVSSLPEKGRALWERRACNLEDDASSIQSSLDKHLGQYYKVRREEENRKALFGEPRAGGGGADDETKSMLKERNSLRDSSNMLDEVLGQGQGILDGLVGQNQILKGAKRKLLDAANVMGVSASLVQVIDRRQTGDKWLVYGGMALTLFILFSLW